MVESIESQYIDISTYRLLSGSSYVKLPVELRSPKKWLINSEIKIKNVFFSIILDILIPLKSFQKELQRKIGETF